MCVECEGEAAPHASPPTHTCWEDPAQWNPDKGWPVPGPGQGGACVGEPSDPSHTEHGSSCNTEDDDEAPSLILCFVPGARCVAPTYKGADEGRMGNTRRSRRGRDSEKGDADAMARMPGAQQWGNTAMGTTRGCSNMRCQHVAHHEAQHEAQHVAQQECGTAWYSMCHSM